MSLLAELNTILDGLGVPVETGIFTGVPPGEYVVLTPLVDDFALFGDNQPLIDVSEVRLSVFSKQNYRSLANLIVKALLEADITITDRRYLGYEEESEYHHYVVDGAKHYELEE